MRILYFLLLPAFFLTACTTNVDTERATDIINDVKETYAPDKRVATVDVEAKSMNGQVVLKGETTMAEAKSELLQKMEAAGLEVMDSIEVLPAADLEGKIYGVVTLSACNIRTRAGHSQELSTQATLGTPLRVYKEDGGWYRVQTPDDYLGWLDSGGFELMDEATYNTWMQKAKVVYLSDFGFSYSEPDTESTPVSDLVEGYILAFRGTENNFAEVSYPDGRIAYIPAAEVMGYDLWLASRDPNQENILAKAYDFVGRPYLWGGTSGKGIDCSGFTKTVFYLNGVILPRDASQQVHTGVEIETDTSLQNLQVGDLLFFGRKATEDRPERIVHVAIYAGDGKIIHSSGQVREESLRPGDPTYNDYRMKTFVRAKRVLQAPGEYGTELLTESPFYALPELPEGRTSSLQ